MANYYGSARSNYFKIKDRAAFEKAMENFQVTIVAASDDPELITLLSDEADGGGWANTYYDESKDDYVDFEIENEVAPHLQDDWVAVFMEAGAEKLRYINAYAVAINNQGQVVRLDLSDVYDMARSLGKHITDAAY